MRHLGSMLMESLLHMPSEVTSATLTPADIVLSSPAFFGTGNEGIGKDSASDNERYCHHKDGLPQ